MLNVAVVASLLVAVLVEVRHHRLLADLELAAVGDRAEARLRRTRFLVETWALSGVALLALLLAQGAGR